MGGASTPGSAHPRWLWVCGIAGKMAWLLSAHRVRSDLRWAGLLLTASLFGTWGRRRGISRRSQIQQRSRSEGTELARLCWRTRSVDSLCDASAFGCRSGACASYAQRQPLPRRRRSCVEWSQNARGETLEGQRRPTSRREKTGDAPHAQVASGDHGPSGARACLWIGLRAVG
jgi:hypothetical protein